MQRQRGGRLWHDLTDEFGVTWSMPADHPLYMDISHHPLAKATLDDLCGYPFPKGDDPGRFAGLRQRALELRRDTPYAVVSGISGVVYEICWYLRGLEQWFIDMLTQPEFCEALLDRTLKFWLDWFRVFLDEVGDLVDVIMIGDDLAGQKGPLFRPAFYRRVVKPRQKRLVEYIRSRTAGQDLVPHLRRCTELYSRPVGQRHRRSQPGADQRARAWTPRAEDGVRRGWPFGAGPWTPSTAPQATPEECGEQVQRTWRFANPAAATCSTTCTTSRPGSRRRTSWPCTTPAYEFGFYR